MAKVITPPILFRIDRKIAFIIIIIIIVSAVMNLRVP